MCRAGSSCPGNGAGSTIPLLKYNLNRFVTFKMSTMDITWKSLFRSVSWLLQSDCWLTYMVQSGSIMFWCRKYTKNNTKWHGLLCWHSCTILLDLKQKKGFTDTLRSIFFKYNYRAKTFIMLICHTIVMTQIVIIGPTLVTPLPESPMGPCFRKINMHGHQWREAGEKYFFYPVWIVPWITQMMFVK